jgi:hypothetical protein
MEGSRNNHPYERLTPRTKEIHLFELFPGITDSQKIGCFVCQPLLGDELAYNALSYTWGNADNSKIILVDNLIFRISTRLETALQDIRHLNLATFNMRRK